jgi:hypothetical protein
MHSDSTNIMAQFNSCFINNTRGCTSEMPQNKFPLILMKLGDLVGIAFIKMHLKFFCQNFDQNLTFFNLLKNWGVGGLVTGLMTGLDMTC